MVSKYDIVILGCGFAGLACARQLEKWLGRDAARRVLVVNSENYFTFYALLPDVVGASLEPRHVIHPVRQLLRGCAVRRADVAGVDLARRRVEFDDTGEVVHGPVEAEHLVLALGSGTDMRAVPGMMEHAFFLKTLADALQLRGHIIRRLEEAVCEANSETRKRLLQFVVVGGGFSGVETAGQMLDMLASARRFYPELYDTPPQVTLVHSGATLLPELDEVLGKTAQASLERRGLKVLVNRRVAAIGADAVFLEGGDLIPAENVVCTIGNSPHPVLKSLDVEKLRGRVVTDEFLRLKGFTNVWAAGDGAACPDGLGNICPPTGQYATRLGKHLAKNLRASFSGTPVQPFRHASVGQVATIGHHAGVCKLRGFRFSGFFAWWLARTVHLMLLPRLELKLRVMLDWTLELFFPRDLNYLDLTRTEAVGHVHLQPADVLFRQGDRSQTFYVIEEGVMELTRRDANGQIVFQSELRAGDHFGEGSLLRKDVRSTTAVAKSPTRLLALGPRDFQTLVASCKVLKETLHETSHRFRPDEEFAKFPWPDEILALPVSAVMSQPVETLPESSTIADAVRFVAERRRGQVPLVDAAGKLTGVVTRTDLYRLLAEQQPLDGNAQALAVTAIQTLPPDETVREALELFRRRRLKHVPIVDAERRPIGILSYIDVAMAALRARPAPSSTAAS